MRIPGRKYSFLRLLGGVFYIAGIMSKGKIRVATCQFAEQWQPRRNMAMILRYMRRARTQRADLVHFHEGALSGYLSRPGAPSAAEIDWRGIRDAADRIRDEARKLKLWVALGSAHRLTPPHKPTNCLYLIGPDGKIHDRYDKRFCTPGDLSAYTPGGHFVVFSVNGVKCSLLICFDLRFPELYRELKKRGAQAIFQSFHNGYSDGPGVHNKIMRETMQAHAGINYFWISMNNSSGRYSRWPSVFIRPDGTIAAALKQNVAGVMVNTIDTTLEFYDASAAFRRRAMRGILSSGSPIKDARLKNRTSL